jgi:hypothetical protein
MDGRQLVERRVVVTVESSAVRAERAGPEVMPVHKAPM